MMNLHSYTYQMTIRPQGKQTGKRSRFAIELEVNHQGARANRTRCIDNALSELHEGFFCATSDCTVDIEFKAQPATLTHLLPNLRSLYDTLTRYDIDGRGAGLHVHIMRDTFGITQYAQAMGVYKMAIIASRFTSLIEHYSGRACNDWADMHLINYCLSQVGSFDRHPFTTDCEQFLELMQTAVHVNHSARYSVINCDKPFSFELRLGAGRANYASAAQYLRFVQAWVNVCKRRNLGLQWFFDCTQEAFERELQYELSLITD